MYLFVRFKDGMINAVSWIKLKLVSRKGVFFTRMMYRRENKQFSNIIYDF